MKLMVIDGNSIVNRAFFGIRMLNAPDGTPTNGIYGFLTILQKLLDEDRPDGVCVAFDLKAPTFRHRMYDGYKAQRKGMPEELAVQMPILKEVLDAMGIRRLEQEGFEADDILGTLGARCAGTGDTCLLVTGDKDSFQLISDSTTVLHVKTRMGRTETVAYTPEVFREEYGFEPPRMVDLKALMGDTSDNIPGVPGVGEKTALDLLHKFGSLEGVYEHLEDPEIKDGVRKKLAAGRESARLSFDLATIVTDVPLDFTPSEAVWHNDFRPELYDLFMRLGFLKFIEKYGLTPTGDTPAEQVFEGTCESFPLRSPDAAAAAAEEIRKSGETVCAVCDPDLGYVVVHVDRGDDAAAYVLDRGDFDGDYTAALGALLAPDIPKAGHNVKDTMRALLGLGLSPEGWVFDTALAAYLLDATAGSYDLSRLTVQYCGFEVGRVDSGELEQLSLLEETRDAAEKLGNMASEAAAIACLREVLEQKLRENGMERLYREVELPLCRVLADMEHEGFLADREMLERYGEMLGEGIDDSQSRIYTLAGGEFNINSTKKLGEVLFEQLGLPPVKKTKTGYSTNIEVLEKLRGRHPIIDEIIRYRQLTKLKSTYADGLLKVIGPDGRIHTTFQMTVTATGRLSSVEPNLQNIPVRQELGSELRRMFVAKEGCVLVDADYSQIELRVLAAIAGDTAMRDAFLSGEDIHTVTASQVFGVPVSEVTHAMRSSAKAVNFGIVYGISDFSLAQDIGVTKAEAKAYMDSYLNRYSGVRQYMAGIKEQAKKDGYVTTLLGRRRSLPELKSSNFNLRSFGERAAMNTPIQGTAADIIKLAMVRVHSRLEREGLRAKLILQVHDELIIESPEDEADTVRRLLREEMENVLPLPVPLKVDTGVGRSWFDAK